MAINSASIEKAGGWYGFITGIAFVVVSLILYYTGLTNVLALRGIYVLIMVIGVCLAISSVKKARQGRINYLQGIGAGALTALVSSIFFGVVLVILISFLDKGMMSVVESGNPVTDPATISSVFLIITMAGFVGGSLIAFIAMQFFKSPDHKLSN